MPTPVGPAPRDPDDPDNWDEWYDDEDAPLPPPRPFPLWLKVVAVLLLVAFVSLFVLG